MVYQRKYLKPASYPNWKNKSDRHSRNLDLITLKSQDGGKLMLK